MTSEYHDRLSELPDAVLFEVFWRMPMRDVVRTCVLSKRWTDRWKKNPFLKFDNRGTSLSNKRFVLFADRILAGTLGPPTAVVSRFSLHWYYSPVSKDHGSAIKVWVVAVLKCGVEELCLDLDGNRANVEEEYYQLPQRLYSCESLMDLALKRCNLRIFETVVVKWSELENLHLEDVNLTAHEINKILSGTPKLRVFFLQYVNIIENLTIESDSLKELTIATDPFNPKCLSVVSELSIWTPELQTLKILGCSYSNYLLKDVSSLTCATIVIGVEIGEIGVEIGARQWEHVGNALNQLLATIQDVGINVELLSCYTQVFDVVKLKCVSPTFINVKSLELNCGLHDYEQVVSILGIFPQLEKLVLKCCLKSRRECWDRVEANLQLQQVRIVEGVEANLQLQQLRIVEVTWARGDDVFPLIEFLLKYANNLEKFVFQLEGKWPGSWVPSDLFFSVSQKLLRMRRSSTYCTIDLTVI